LNITHSGSETKFSIDAMGVNGHSCTLDGHIVNAKATLETLPQQPACTILFKASAASMEVETPTEEACRCFCGMRASFTGTYYLPKSNCTGKGKSSIRQRIDGYYKNKAYGQAVSTLAPLLTECAETLHWMESGRIRNDVAIALFHAGRLQECREVLKPVLETAGSNETELRESLPPVDFLSFLTTARATWHNAKLCAEP
jgi:hypothetical protein